MKLLLCDFSPRKKNYSSKGDVRIFEPVHLLSPNIIQYTFEKNKKNFLENVENRRKNALQILKVVVLYRGSLTKAVCAGVKQREYVHHFPPYHIFLSLGSLRFTRGLSFDFSGSLSNVGV